MNNKIYIALLLHVFLSSNLFTMMPPHQSINPISKQSELMAVLKTKDLAKYEEYMSQLPYRDKKTRHNALCDACKYNGFPPQILKRICSMKESGINERDSEGRLPLLILLERLSRHTSWLALQEKCNEIIKSTKMLLDNGADPHIGSEFLKPNNIVEMDRLTTKRRITLPDGTTQEETTVEIFPHKPPTLNFIDHVVAFHKKNLTDDTISITCLRLLGLCRPFSEYATKNFTKLLNEENYQHFIEPVFTFVDNEHISRITLETNDPQEHIEEVQKSLAKPAQKNMTNILLKSQLGFSKFTFKG